MLKFSIKANSEQRIVLEQGFYVTCVTYLKGLFIIQQVSGMVHGKNSQVEESTGRADMQIEREESTLNKAVCVSV